MSTGAVKVISFKFSEHLVPNNAMGLVMEKTRYRLWQDIYLSIIKYASVIFFIVQVSRLTICSNMCTNYNARVVSTFMLLCADKLSVVAWTLNATSRNRYAF